MSRLRILVDVDGAIDPTLNDPEEIASFIMDTYEEFQQVNPHYPPVDLVTADWS